MRLVMLSFLSFSVALPAFAQGIDPAQPQLPPQTAPQVYNTPINVAPNPTISVPAAGAVIAAPAVRPPAQPALEDIGFDPKVKRDPSGHVLKEQTGVPAPITDANSLRVDSAAGMRSDVAGRPVIVPAPVTVKRTTTTTTTTPTVSPSSGQIQH